MNDTTAQHEPTPNDDLAMRLKGAAPMLGAAIQGIEAIAGILIGARVERDTEAGSLAGIVSADRETRLLGVAAFLANRVYLDLAGIIGGDGKGAEGEDFLCWGSHAYLSGEFWEKVR